MIVAFAVAQDLELAFLDDVGVCRLLALLSDELIVLAMEDIGVPYQLFELSAGEALKEWDPSEELELAVILLDFNLLEHANVVAAVQDCHAGRFNHMHRLLPAGRLNIFDLERILPEASPWLELLFLDPPFEEAEFLELDQVNPFDRCELDEAFTIESIALPLSLLPLQFALPHVV